MKTQATFDDANLILRLYDLRREETLRAGRKWFGTMGAFGSREQWLQICPPGSDENAYFRMVTTYWDMASSFVANGILDPELFFRSNNVELLYVWQKVKSIVAETRKAQKNELYLSNLEKVAASFIEFFERESPGFYEQFSANVAKIQMPKKN
jgi:hypothetical protein